MNLKLGGGVIYSVCMCSCVGGVYSVRGLYGSFGIDPKDLEGGNSLQML